jgi:membrane protease YdiL (CAAX protease family)
MTGIKKDFSPDNNSLRERVGKSLLENKIAIFASILIVIFISQVLKIADPDLMVLGRSISFWGIPLALLAIWIISWFKEVGWSDLGLTRPENWKKTINVALIAMVIVQVIGALQFALSDSPPNLSSYQQGLTFKALLGWIAISWTTAGIGEEIIYRGFFMKQFARVFDDQERSSWIVGLVLSSILFGLVHFHQGPGGMLGTGIVGLVYGIAYLVSGRNLWVTIIAHGLTGTTSFILLYLSQLR